MKNIAKRLLSERKRLRLTQTQVASICGISRISYSTYECQHAKMPVTSLAILARHGFDVQYILTGLESPNAAQAGHFAGLSANIEGTLP